MEQLEVHVGETPQPDRVQVAAPGAIRARRFEAVFCCGLQEGEFPRGASPEPFLLRRRPARDRHRQRPRAARARGPARPRALPVLRLRLARGAPARAQLALERRGGQPADRVVLRGRRARAARRTAPSAARARCPRSPGGPRTRPRPRSGTARTRPPARGAPVPRPVPLSSEPLLDELSAPRRRVGPRARELRRLPGQVARREPAEAGGARARPRGDGARLATRTRCSSRTYERLREETGEPPRDPRQPRRRRAHPARGAARPAAPTFQLSPKQTRVRAAARRLEFDLLRFLRSRGRLATAGSSRRARAALRRWASPSRSSSSGGLRVRGRIDRVDECDGMALVIDYKTGKRVDRYKVGELGAGEPLPGRALHAGGREAARPARGGRRLRGARQQTTRARAAWWPSDVDELGDRWFDTDRLPPDEFQEKLDWALGRIRETDARDARRRAAAPAPTAATGTAAASTRRCAGASGERADAGAAAGPSSAATARCWCGPAPAPARRPCWSSASSRRWSRTASRWSQVLAITFTEKAAAEMKSRVRRRFLELGRREDARAAESAWVSTIHGFCARILRAHALSAGIDPDFRVLDELEARADRRRRVRRRARGRSWADGPATGSRWWPPTRPTGCATWCAPPTRTCAAAGERRPRLEETLPPAAGGRGRRGWRPRARARARRGRAASVAARSSGSSVRRRLERRRRRARGAGELRAAAAATPRRSARTPATSTARRSPAYTRARGGERASTATTRMLRVLLELYGERYERGKRDRSALDFEDLELLARDLLRGRRGPARGSTPSRFEHVLVDEFQDTNPLQNELLGAARRATTCSGSATRTSRSTASATPT